MRKIALIGGDERLLYAAEGFRQAGLCPFVYGNEGAVERGFSAPYTVKETLADAEAVLLGIPTEKKKGFIFAPRFEGQIACGEVADLVPNGATVFLWGRPRDGTFDGHHCYDLALDPLLLRQNARATAEAALILAMKEGGRALFCTRSAILGFGRIAGQLAMDLLSLGTEVRVGARREESRRSAALLGCTAFSPEEKALLAGADLIFNTVPAPVLTPDALSAIDKNALYIELASPPGGIGQEECPCKWVNGASLPGRFCPKSAGDFVAQAVLCQLQGQGEVISW